jgi:hypothetical protein
MRRLCALSLAFVACSAPDYRSGDLMCEPQTNACPDGFTCDQTIGRCVRRTLGPPSTCATSSALLCDGFEQSPLATLWGSQGAVAIDSTLSFRGASSVHFHSGPTTSAGGSTITETRTFPVPGTLYLRAWAYFKSPFPSPTNVFLLIDSTAAANGTAYGLQNGAVTNNAFDVNQYIPSTLTVPTDVWVCLQYQVSQTGPTGDIHLFVNGTEATDAALRNTMTPKFAALFLGLGSDQTPPPAGDLWIDELILDDKPTTCDE